MKIDISKMKTVQMKKGKMGGEPCLGEHRITITQILVEIANEFNILDITENYRLKKDEIKNFILELASNFVKDKSE
jgi:uncharacterized protein (DUF433 family)